MHYVLITFLVVCVYGSMKLLHVLMANVRNGVFLVVVEFFISDIIL